MKKIFVAMLLGFFLFGCIFPPEPPVQPNVTKNTTKINQTVVSNLTNVSTVVVWNGTVNVGFVGPLSGNASSYGKAVHYALQLAVDEINEKGGINGAKLKMISADGACSPLIAKKSAEGLVKNNNVQVIFGGVCSEESEGMGAILEDNKVVLLSPTTTGMYSTAEDFRFVLGGNVQSAAKKLSDYGEKQNWIRVAIINEGQEYSRAMGNAFKNEFNSRGRIISSHQIIPTNIDDVGTPVYSMKITGPHAVVIFTESPLKSSMIMKELKISMTNASLIGGEIEIMPKTLEFAQKDSEGLVGTMIKYNASNPKVQDFLKKYENKYGKPSPVPWMAITARDGLHMVAEIMIDGGYTQNDGNVIRNELNKLKKWEGTTDKITFDLQGNANLDYELVVVKDGKTEKIN